MGLFWHLATFGWQTVAGCQNKPHLTYPYAMLVNLIKDGLVPVLDSWIPIDSGGGKESTITDTMSVKVW